MRPSFHLSAETDRLVRLFASLPIDHEMTYQEIQATVGSYSQSAYQSAVRISRRNGVVIATIRGVGCKRLTASQTVDRQSSHMKAIRRKARIVQTEVSIASKGNLTREEDTRAMLISAAAGIILANATVPKTNTPEIPDPNPQPLDSGRPRF